MLEKMRGSIGSVFIKILFGLLILSFMAWGIGDILNPSSTGQSVARVGEREISRQELATAYQRQANYLRQRGFSQEMINRLGLTDQVINDLVGRALFEAEADSLGMEISDAIVVTEIRSQQAFQNSLGQFDRARFEMALQQIGYSEAYYVNALKREIATSQLLDSLADGAQAPDSITREIFDWREESRSADFFIYPVDETLPVSAPGENDIKAHYDMARESFRVPELRDLSYLHISPAALAEEIDISDDEIAISYDERRDAFTIPERRHLQQILLPDQETAQEAADLLAEGKDFAEVAMELANMEESTMDLGFLARDTVPDEQLAQVAFALDLNEISAPTEGLFGWFIVRVIDIQDSTVSPLEDIREQLRRDLAVEQANDQIFARANELIDAISGGNSLEEAANALGAKVRTVKSLDARGYINSQEPATGIPDAVKFLQMAFETEEGLDSFVEELDDNSYLVLRVDKVIPARIRELDEVRTEIQEILLADLRHLATKAKVEEALEKIRAGTSLENQGAALGFDVKSVRDIKRDGNTPGREKLPPAALAKLFTMENGQVDFADTRSAFFLLKATAQKAANKDIDSAVYEAIQSQLAAAVSSDLMAQYNDALRARHDVTLNRLAINDFEQRLQNY